MAGDGDETGDFQSADGSIEGSGSSEEGGGSGNESVAMVDFDAENKDDAAEVAGKLYQIKLTYDDKYVLRWINRLEIQMETYGVASQWSKRIVLENNLPPKVENELNDLFQKRKTVAGASIYLECKTLLLKKHGKKPEDDVKKAMKLVMTDTPSEAADKLVDLICDKPKPLVDCCCSKVVSTIWRDMLPPTVRAQVAAMDLKANYQGTVDHADTVFMSLRDAPSAGGVAAVSKKPAQGEEEEVAAIGRGRGRGGSRGRGRGQGQNTQNGQNQSRGAARASARGRRGPTNPKDRSTWGDPHPDGPPPEACMQHY